MGETVNRGCLFCRTGKEAAIARQLALAFPDARAVAPTKSRYRRTRQGAVEEQVTLLPGYVFFEIGGGEAGMARLLEDMRDGDGLNTGIRDFARSENVLRLLCYNDGDWRLHGADDRFAKMLLDADGNIGVSTAYFDENRRIRILDGFLKDYEGSIVRVNHKMKTVEVLVDFQDKRVSLKLGYELVAGV